MSDKPQTTIIPQVIIPVSTWVKCLACDGTGAMRSWDQYANTAGPGWRYIGRCWNCNGTGSILVGTQP